jgi:hypothetical protein
MVFATSILSGCNSEISSRHIGAGQFLCFDQGGISDIELDPVGNDLYICKDGSQFVVGYGKMDEENYYFIYHNTSQPEANEMLDRILLPKKWAKRDEVVEVKPKDINKIMSPASAIMEDRGL